MLALPHFVLFPLFVSLLCGVASAEPTATPESSLGGETGIEGVITISPIVGGPLRQGAPNSKPLPDMAFVVRKGTEEVATFTTDAEGHYRVALPPGEYQVRGRDQKSRVGFWGPFPIVVDAGKMTRKNFECDSGLQ
ncbi:MAG: carboxypeptidase-like regulatory domain-containing protein [Chthoniobacterales bacterium]